MIPEEKAIDLIKEHLEKVSGVPRKSINVINYDDAHVKTAVQCSIVSAKKVIIALDELIYMQDSVGHAVGQKAYWVEVREHLEQRLK